MKGSLFKGWQESCYVMSPSEALAQGDWVEFESNVVGIRHYNDSSYIECHEDGKFWTVAGTDEYYSRDIVAVETWLFLNHVVWEELTPLATYELDDIAKTFFAHTGMTPRCMRELSQMRDEFHSALPKWRWFVDLFVNAYDSAEESEFLERERRIAQRFG